MTDCESHECHERVNAELAQRPTWTEHNEMKDKVGELKDEIKEKIPKAWLKWVWIVGGPLFVVAAVVWSGQNSDALRYASKPDLAKCELRLGRLETTMEMTNTALSQIQTNTGTILNIVSHKAKPGDKDGNH